MRVTHVITRLIVGGAQENTAASVLGRVPNPLGGRGELARHGIDVALSALPGKRATKATPAANAGR